MTCGVYKSPEQRIGKIKGKINKQKTVTKRIAVPTTMLEQLVKIFTKTTDVLAVNPWNQMTFDIRDLKIVDLGIIWPLIWSSGK